MKVNSIAKKPFLLFLPFLIFYCLFILFMGNKPLSGDELRYANDVKNLLQGYFSPALPGITLFNGPGYPLIILPLAAFFPFIIVKLLNAFFLYFSIIFIYKILVSRVSLTKTLLCCFFWACYYHNFVYLPYSVPEIISSFFVALVFLLLTKAFADQPQTNTRRYLLLAGLAFGYLALIKVIFGYVLICMLTGSTILWLTKRRNENYRKGMVVLIAAFITVLPYLVYTYNLTGRVMYWSSLGGNNLYWMTRYGEQETGSWYATPYLKNDSLAFNTAGDTTLPNEPAIKQKTDRLPGYTDSILKIDTKNLRDAAKYKDSPLEQDDLYKKAAMENIRSHPAKFINNCFSNIGRILFNFPYSYSMQKTSTLAWLPLNGTIVLLMLFCIIPTFKNWRQIPYAIRFMLFVTLLYLGGSVLGSAEIRMFTVIVPVLLVWIAYTLHRSVKINLKRWDK